MNVVRALFALAAVLAATACGTREITAPMRSAAPPAAHANEGFLGSGNNSVPMPVPDSIRL